MVALVLALHGAFVSMLLLRSTVPPAGLMELAAPSMVWLRLPEQARLRLPSTPGAALLHPIAPVRPVRPDAEPLAIPGFAEPPELQVTPQVDWWSEARRVVRDIAASRTASEAATATDESRSSSGSAGGIGSDSPAHHAGEQYRMETGERVYWVSDGCYIVSAPPATAIPDFLTVPRPPRTVCPGASSTPRGDLFKSVPAYGRFHPE